MNFLKEFSAASTIQLTYDIRGQKVLVSNNIWFMGSIGDFWLSLAKNNIAFKD